MDSSSSRRAGEMQPRLRFFSTSINVESRLFINGVAQETHGLERMGLYSVPGTNFIRATMWSSSG